MALSQATLAFELQTMAPTSTPGVAEIRLATAYGVYMKVATAGVVPIITSAINSLAVPAMTSAMTFVPGASAAGGAAVVTAGLTAFWGAMVAAPPAFFALATVITPPPFGTLTAELTAVFVNNVATNADLIDATEAMAKPLHLQTVGLGSATFPGPIVSPIV
jgi:hypothetical protein